MENSSSYDRKRTWFVLGSVLTWILSVPFLIGMFNAFRGISEQKATGLGAVAGGLAEIGMTLAIILGFGLPIAAIVLLIKSFAPKSGTRSLISVLYICWNAFMFVVVSLLAWLSLVYLPHKLGRLP
jgi:hypothetical protein